MERTEAIVAVAGLLFVAFLIGFLTHWLVSRLSRVAQADLMEMERLAAALQAAEAGKAAAEAANAENEARMRARLQQAEAELKAAMDGLRAARHEAETLRARQQGSSVDAD